MRVEHRTPQRDIYGLVGYRDRASEMGIVSTLEVCAKQPLYIKIKPVKSRLAHGMNSQVLVLLILVAELVLSTSAELVTYSCVINSSFSLADVKTIRNTINAAHVLSTEVPLSEIIETDLVPRAIVGRASLLIALIVDRVDLIFDLDGIHQYNSSAVIYETLNATNLSLDEVNIIVNATFLVIGYVSLNKTFSLAEFRKDLARDLNVTLSAVTLEPNIGLSNVFVSATINNFATAKYTKSVFARLNILNLKIVATVTVSLSSATGKRIQALFNERLSVVTMTQLTQRFNDNLILQGFWSDIG
jgi:hypothetical protein